MLDASPRDLSSYIKEKAPTTLEETADFASKYLNARDRQPYSEPYKSKNSNDWNRQKHRQKLARPKTEYSTSLRATKMLHM